MNSIPSIPQLCHQSSPRLPLSLESSCDLLEVESPENDLEKQKLILFTHNNGPRRFKKTKNDYIKELENNNVYLQNLVFKLQRQITA